MVRRATEEDPHTSIYELITRLSVFHIEALKCSVMNTFIRKLFARRKKKKKTKKEKKEREREEREREREREREERERERERGERKRERGEREGREMVKETVPNTLA